MLNYLRSKLLDDPLAPARKIVLLYGLLSFLWILLSDRAVDAMFPRHDDHMLAQTYKGWIFVALTTVLLYFGLTQLYQRLVDSTEAAIKALRRELQTGSVLDAIAENSPDVIFAKDLDGRYLLFNNAAASLTGLSVEKALGRDDYEIFPQNVAERFRENDQQVIAGGTARSFVEDLPTPEGHQTFVSIKGPLNGSSGLIGTFGISRNMTAMLELQKRLEDSEFRYRVIFERSPQPLLLFDLDSLRFLDVNQAAVDFYGYPRSDFLQMTMADIRPPDRIDQMRQTLDAFPNTDVPLLLGPLVHQNSEGRLIDVMVSACDLKLGTARVRMVVVSDITEATRFAHERDEALLRLSDILSRVTDGFMAVDQEERLTYVNAMAAQYIAAPLDSHEMIGRSIWELIPGAVGTRYEQAYRSSIGDGRSVVVEDWFEPWQRWIECRIYPSGQGTSVYFTDVSQRREAMQALEVSRAELSALAGQLNRPGN